MGVIFFFKQKTAYEIKECDWSSDVCSSDLILGMSESAVSHQLRMLRLLKLVKFRKEGRVVYYSLDDEHIRHLFDDSLKHAREP